MAGLDVTHSAGAGAHHDGRSASAPAEILHTVEQLSAGDAGRGKGDIVGLDEITGIKDPLKVDAVGFEFFAFLIGAGPNFALHFAADTFEGGGGQDCFGGASDSQEYVDSQIVFHCRLNSRGDIAIGNKANASACFTDLSHDFFVAVAIEDYDGQI